MKTTKNTENTNTSKLVWIDEQFAVGGVNNYSDTCCFFNLYIKSAIGNVAIYGCRVVSGGKGDFISFPAEKYTAKDGSIGYKNYASIKFEDGMTSKIIKAVQEQIG